MRNAILLIIGIVLSLLLLVCPAQIFELLYYNNEFSNEMYNEQLYIIVAIVTCVVAWGVALLFYFAINSVSFSRWWHWLIMAAVATVLAPVINFVWVNRVFTSLGYDFQSQLTSFCLIDALVTLVMFVIASFSVRWWSSNCRHTPIPE